VDLTQSPTQYVLCFFSPADTAARSPRLRMSGVIPLVSLFVFMTRTWTTLPLNYKQTNKVLPTSSQINTSLSIFPATILFVFRYDLPTSKTSEQSVFTGAPLSGEGRCVYCMHCFMISMHVFWPIRNVTAGLRLHI
jgi:hypothetical protein